MHNGQRQKKSSTFTEGIRFVSSKGISSVSSVGIELIDVDVKVLLALNSIQLLLLFTHTRVDWQLLLLMAGVQQLLKVGGIEQLLLLAVGDGVDKVLLLA